MKQVAGLAICCAILYGIDAALFSGWYASGLQSAMHEVYVRW
jgi:hypothetical protein